MTMLNATRGVKVTGNGGHRVSIPMLRGQFLLNAILLDEIFDVSEIGIVRAWPYWYNNDFANAYTAAYRDNRHAEPRGWPEDGLSSASSPRRCSDMASPMARTPGAGCVC